MAYKSWYDMLIVDAVALMSNVDGWKYTGSLKIVCGSRNQKNLIAIVGMLVCWTYFDASLYWSSIRK